INMVEAAANEVTEEVMLEAIMFGHEEIKRLIAFQEEIIESFQVEKMDIKIVEMDEAIVEEVEAKAKDSLVKAIQVQEKHAREEAIDQVKTDVFTAYEEEEADDDKLKQVANVLDKIVKEEVRR